MATKKNLITLLGIAFVVAIIATGLFYGLVAGKLSENAAVSQSSIVVAAHDLKPGAVLAPSDVKLAPRSSVDALVEGFGSEAQVTGLVVMMSVVAGKPLIREVVASKESARGAALGVPPGMRAVSIHVTDSTGVVQLLKPGHRVDAQLVYTRGDRSGDATTLRTLLQDLEVLRVEPEPEVSQGRPVLPVVTLLARPEEADALGLADAVARVRLLLRHPLDDELTERPSVSLVNVMRNPPKQERRGSHLSNTGSASRAEAPAAKGVETAAARQAEP